MDTTCLQILQNLCDQYNTYKSAQMSCAAGSCDTNTINTYQRYMDSLMAQIKVQQTYCKAQIDLACDSLPVQQQQVYYYIQYPQYAWYRPRPFIHNDGMGNVPPDNSGGPVANH